MEGSVVSDDRVGDKSIVSDEVAITKFEDKVAITESGMVSGVYPNPLHSVSTIPLAPLKDILARSYPVWNGSWSTSQNMGVNLVTLQFPHVLFSIPFLYEKMKNFKYFRAGIRIEIRVNASRFLYGRLIASWDPMSSCSLTNTNSVSVSASSCFPHLLISASTNETSVIEMPFLNPNLALDLEQHLIANPADYLKDMIGALELTVMNPLTAVNADVGAMVYIAINASFIEPQLWGPSEYVSSQPQYNVRIKDPEYVEAQGLMSTISAANQESIKKSGQGIISRVLDKASQIAPVFSTIPLVGPIAPIASIGFKFASEIFKKLGFDKPRSLTALQPVSLDFLKDLTNGMGLDNNICLSLEAENAVAVCPSLGGSNVDEMDFAYICSVPGLQGVAQWSAQDIVGKQIYYMEVTPNGGSPILAHCANVFAYWRGAMKYKIYITASQFHSGRIVVQWNPTDSGATVTPYMYDCASIIVDVQTDTEVEFEVPFVYYNYWASTNDSVGRVSITVLTPLSVPDVTTNPLVYLNVYCSGGSDLEFNMLSNQIATPPTDFVEAQSNPRLDFNKKFKTIISGGEAIHEEGITFGERIKSLRTLLHKYSYLTPITPISSNCFNIQAYGTLLSWKDVTTLRDHFKFLFKFEKGSINYKVVDQGTGMMVATVSTDMTGNKVSDSSNGIETNYPLAVAVPSYKPALEFTIPWMSGSAFTIIYPQQYGIVLGAKVATKTSFTNNMTVFESVGDDYSLMFIKGPPSNLSWKNVPPMITSTYTPPEGSAITPQQYAESSNGYAWT